MIIIPNTGRKHKMMEIKRLVIILFSTLSIALLVGCGKPAPKKEAEILQDIQENDTFLNDLHLQQTEISILTRENVEDLDSVKCLLTAANEEFDYQVTYQLQYELNEKIWMLKDWKIEEENVTLKPKAFEQLDIQKDFGEYDEIQILNDEKNGEQAMYLCTVQAIQEMEYGKVLKTCEAKYVYSVRGGWSQTACEWKPELNETILDEKSMQGLWEYEGNNIDFSLQINAIADKVNCNYSYIHSGWTASRKSEQGELNFVKYDTEQDWDDFGYSADAKSELVTEPFTIFLSPKDGVRLINAADGNYYCNKVSSSIEEAKTDKEIISITDYSKYPCEFIVDFDGIDLDMSIDEVMNKLEEKGYYFGDKVEFADQSYIEYQYEYDTKEIIIRVKPDSTDINRIYCRGFCNQDDIPVMDQYFRQFADSEEIVGDINDYKAAYPQQNGAFWTGVHIKESFIGLEYGICYSKDVDTALEDNILQ